LYIRITIDGQRADISTKGYVNPDFWNQKFQKMEGKTEDTRSVNAYLKTMEHQVFQAHRQLIDVGKTITLESLKNRITGVEDKQQMLQQIIKAHNDDTKVIIGRGCSHATWVKYNNTKKHL